MTKPNPFLHFNISSRSFLSRARQHLACFEEDESVENFFYAALQLRFGIEARLNEYLKPALKSIGKESKQISDYVATKLLKRLIAIDPDADRQSTLRITSEQDGHSVKMQFTPVSKRLASIHGQLGELLHYKFFINNEHWMIRKPFGGNPHRSLPDFLPLLKAGINELQQATSGTLLGSPQFTQLVEEIAMDASDESQTDDG